MSSGSYTIGEVSGLLFSKKKKKKSELDILFSSESRFRAEFKSSCPVGDAKEVGCVFCDHFSLLKIFQIS
jgi:hypothetical protein